MRSTSAFATRNATSATHINSVNFVLVAAETSSFVLLETSSVTETSACASAAMSMYVRVKRAKQTIFLHVEPTETILEVKQKIQALTDKPVFEQRLFLHGSDQHKLHLEDAKSLAELKVENDAILALVYKVEGDGEEYEAINIETVGGAAEEAAVA